MSEDRVLADEPEAGGDSQWRFDLDEVGPESEPDPLEPGSPTRENIAFVILGAVGTVFAIIQLVRPFA